MAKVRIDLLFDRYKAGWAESYFKESPEGSALFTTVSELIQQRRALLGNSAFIIGYRLTPYTEASGLPDPTKGGGSFTVPASQGVGLVPLPLDVPAVSILARWTTAEPKSRKNVWLRGWSDASVTYGSAGNEDLNDPMRNAFRVFRDYIAAGTWYCRVFDVTVSGNEGMPIQSLFFDFQGYMGATLGVVPTGIKAGDLVKLRGYRGDFGRALNGQMRVTALSGGNTIKTNRYSCENSDANEEGPGGLFHRNKYRWVPILGGEVHKYSTHHTGKPFFLTAGRRGKKAQILITPADAALTFSARAQQRAISLGWTPPTPKR